MIVSVRGSPSGGEIVAVGVPGGAQLASSNPLSKVQVIQNVYFFMETSNSDF
jgi:hypothetical protein